MRAAAIVEAIENTADKLDCVQRSAPTSERPAIGVVAFALRELAGEIREIDGLDIKEIGKEQANGDSDSST